MRTLLLFVAVLGALGAGCLRKTEFKCSESTQCGAGGACESTGFCSFADPDCDSGRRYAEYAGTTYSSQCVGGDTTDTDGGVDGPGDGSLDDSLMGCSTTYDTVIGNHRYRVITAAASWMGQRNLCAADGSNAYLAIPDDQGELTAILNAAGADAWVGVEDPSDNGMFATVRGASYPTNNGLWDNGEPDDSPEGGGGPNNAECVLGRENNDKLVDQRCAEQYAAVCECEP